MDKKANITSVIFIIIIIVIGIILFVMINKIWGIFK